jgi:hypothetical protein
MMSLFMVGPSSGCSVATVRGVDARKTGPDFVGEDEVGHVLGDERRHADIGQGVIGSTKKAIVLAEIELFMATCTIGATFAGKLHEIKRQPEGWQINTLKQKRESELVFTPSPVCLTSNWAPGTLAGFCIGGILPVPMPGQHETP